MAVPIITEKMTAGIFSINTMALIPIPMEQHPKIKLIFSLKSLFSNPPANVPRIPPRTTEQTLIITPIGIMLLSLFSIILAVETSLFNSGFMI